MVDHTLDHAGGPTGPAGHSLSASSVNATMNAALPDPQYISRVAGRIERAQRAEITVRQDIDHTKESLERVKQDIATEIALLRAEIAELDALTVNVVERVKQTVLQFKTIVKKGDLARMQGRVDSWAPHEKVTREQFARMVLERM